MFSDLHPYTREQVLRAWRQRIGVGLGVAVLVAVVGIMHYAAEGIAYQHDLDPDTGWTIVTCWTVAIGAACFAIWRLECAQRSSS